MRAVVQRVLQCTVSVDGAEIGKLIKGLLVYLGVGVDDEDSDLSYMVDKFLHLRIFEDDEGKMNKSVVDVDGGICVISQFTLYGDTRKGRRPSFTAAAHPNAAERMYNKAIKMIRANGLNVATGRFGAHMKVSYTNDGPVTVILDSRKTL